MRRHTPLLSFLLAVLTSTIAATATADDVDVLDEVAAEDPAPRRVASAFVSLGWRVMGLADHVSHGPDFQAGVLLFGHLKVGIAGMARPGPINPATFQAAVDPAYRGQSTLQLRSDGAIIGLLLAPTIRVGRVRLELPVTVGFGAFGFYLNGGKRNTPDGEGVSTWENRLLDNADSSGGIAIDMGFRVAVRTRVQAVHPFVGIHYTAVIGYEATLATSYQGFSGVLGVQFGE